MNIGTRKHTKPKNKSRYYNISRSIKEKSFLCWVWVLLWVCRVFVPTATSSVQSRAFVLGANHGRMSALCWHSKLLPTRSCSTNDGAVNSVPCGGIRTKTRSAALTSRPELYLFAAGWACSISLACEFSWQRAVFVFLSRPFCAWVTPWRGPSRVHSSNATRRKTVRNSWRYWEGVRGHVALLENKNKRSRTRTGRRYERFHLKRSGLRQHACLCDIER